MTDVNTKAIDWARVAGLLDVVAKCAGVGPQFTHISNAAMSELRVINDSIKAAAEAPAPEPPRNNPTKSEPDPKLQHKLELSSNKEERRA